MNKNQLLISAKESIIGEDKKEGGSRLEGKDLALSTSFVERSLLTASVFAGRLLITDSRSGKKETNR